MAANRTLEQDIDSLAQEIKNMILEHYLALHPRMLPKIMHMSQKLLERGRLTVWKDVKISEWNLSKFTLQSGWKTSANTQNIKSLTIAVDGSRSSKSFWTDPAYQCFFILLPTLSNLTTVALYREGSFSSVVASPMFVVRPQLYNHARGGPGDTSPVELCLARLPHSVVNLSIQGPFYDDKTRNMDINMQLQRVLPRLERLKIHNVDLEPSLLDRGAPLPELREVILTFGDQSWYNGSSRHLRADPVEAYANPREHYRRAMRLFTNSVRRCVRLRRFPNAVKFQLVGLITVGECASIIGRPRDAYVFDYYIDMDLLKDTSRIFPAARARARARAGSQISPQDVGAPTTTPKPFEHWVRHSLDDGRHYTDRSVSAGSTVMLDVLTDFPWVKSSASGAWLPWEIAESRDNEHWRLSGMAELGSFHYATYGGGTRVDEPFPWWYERTTKRTLFHPVTVPYAGLPPRFPLLEASDAEVGQWMRQYFASGQEEKAADRGLSWYECVGILLLCPLFLLGVTCELVGNGLYNIYRASKHYLEEVRRKVSEKFRDPVSNVTSD